MILDEEEYLNHYGMPRRSGRYPWGSGGEESESTKRNMTLLDSIDEMKAKGLSDTEIARGLGLSTTEFRAKRSIARNEEKQLKIAFAQKLRDKGTGYTEIGKRMDLPESSVRALLAPGEKEKTDITTNISEMLKERVNEVTYLDVGRGSESYINSGVSQQRLTNAIALLKEQGYSVHSVKDRQVGTGLDTELKILVPPGVTQRDVFLNKEKIQQVVSFSDDGGRSFGKIHPPISVNPKRVEINYAEDGGKNADGVIYVRPGVKDISIGESRYAQVRIKVGNEHYLKGMAVYKDDLPDGVDLLFNTNKSNTGNKFDAMKEIKDDTDYPFGSVVRQIVENPGSPHERVTSAMNIVGTKPGSGEEGSWSTWSNTLSTQFLSKQSPTLVRSQLDMTYERRKQEFNEINALTNPTVKKLLLEKFADGTDSAAIHLDAAKINTRQAWNVILPVSSLPPHQIYAPRFRDGEPVVLIRYPHAGTFEIPELTVTTKHPGAKKLIGADARDAVGIHPSVAAKLSGADFDGDTVLVIPNSQRKIKHSPSLERLKGFDPQREYAPYDGMKTMDGGIWNARTKRVEYGPKGPSSRTKGIKMGDVSNLITDMTIRQASHDEIARAVRHSMVVIDAEKHSLNYKQSAIDNNIKQLKTQYQGTARAGASTLISRATKEKKINERKLRPMSEGGPIDPLTGRKVYVETKRTTVNKKGERVFKQEDAKLLALTDDAHTLSSGTPVEKVYAEHSNKLKDLANQARLASLKAPSIKRVPSSARIYSEEVSSLSSKLALAKKNAPLERQAQIIAKANFKLIKEANPHLKIDSLKKIEYRELANARIRTGAHKNLITITQKEWDAIQAGAISNHMLNEILKNADIEVVSKLATPRTPRLMTSAKTLRAQSMLAQGYTRAQVADQLGVSLTTLDTAINV